MKRRTPILRFAGLLFFIFAFSTAQAQISEETEDKLEMRDVDREHDVILKLHPLHYGEIFVSYERVRSPRVSNEYGLSYLYKGHLKDDGWSTNEKNAMGLALRFSQRYYPSKKRRAPFGFFHGPMFSYRFLVYERNVFGLPELPPNDPNFRFVGRLYQNSLDLSYHLGGQFRLSRHFTTEISGGIGGRLKLATATNGSDLIKENILGRVVHADEDAVIAVAPSPQLNFSIGYAF